MSTVASVTVREVEDLAELLEVHDERPCPRRGSCTSTRGSVGAVNPVLEEAVERPAGFGFERLRELVGAGLLELRASRRTAAGR